jgi:hypothetical protein
MGKQRLCRICKQRPPWKYKNCPPGICKRCYHRHIWVDRPAARKQRQAQAAVAEPDEILFDDVLEIDDLLAVDDVPDVVADLARDDEALLAWRNSPEFASAPPWERNQRELHFHIALQTPDAARRRDLVTNLERLECTVTTLEAETISGYLEYNPRYYTDRKATAQLHKLLNRWQRKGHLTWSASRKK